MIRSPGLISPSPIPTKIIACFADWISQIPVFPAKMPFQHSAITMLEERKKQVAEELPQILLETTFLYDVASFKLSFYSLSIRNKLSQIKRKQIEIFGPKFLLLPVYWTLIN